MTSSAPGAPTGRTSARGPSPGALAILVLALAFTVVAAVPYVAAWFAPDPPGGSPSAPVPGSRPTTTRTPADTDPFADPDSPAARAFEAAAALAEADAHRMDTLRLASVVGSQRVLECNESRTGADAWKSCILMLVLHTAGDGDFTAGHDEIIAALTDPCSFAGTSHVDWTPIPGTARQQQGSCPGRPNAWVHWAPGAWSRGVLDCPATPQDVCTPSSRDIIERLEEREWQGRVRLAYPLDEDTWADGTAGNQQLPYSPPRADGRPTDADILEGDVAAAARDEALAEAGQLAARLGTVNGVELAGVQRTLTCAEGRDHGYRTNADVRVTCQVQVTAYLGWDGGFAAGSRAVRRAVSGACTFAASSFDWEPQKEQTASQQKVECRGARSGYVNWARPGWPSLLHPCLPDARHSCKPSTEAIGTALATHDWASEVSISYHFYQDRW